jgi:hypothetical protein
MVFRQFDSQSVVPVYDAEVSLYSAVNETNVVLGAVVPTTLEESPDGGIVYKYLVTGGINSAGTFQDNLRGGILAIALQTGEADTTVRARITGYVDVAIDNSFGETQVSAGDYLTIKRNGMMGVAPDGQNVYAIAMEDGPAVLGSGNQTAANATRIKVAKPMPGSMGAKASR